jgi:carboxypeptidase C (cathepsin A)
MKMPLRSLVAFVLSFLASAGPPACAADSGEKPASTRRQITVAGKALAYTARAGFLPIRDNETGETHGNMFYIAYAVDQPRSSRPRPLTFLWNGGPGSNSGLLHLLGFGPKRLAGAGGSESRVSASAAAFVNNQDTWLAWTDLVFIDPIGTGYSRPTKAEYAGEFYQNRGDAESVAEFIRVYRIRFDAIDAPLYIVGESYGVTRCALVADALERRRARLAGVFLLSGGLPLAERQGSAPAALNLPTLTAAAYAQHKLPPDLQGGTLEQALQAAEKYARGEYSTALAKPDQLNDAQKDAVREQLARFTGLAAGEIDQSKLVVTSEALSVRLLAGRKLTIGHYDSRLTGPLDPSPEYDPTKDPSLKDILDNLSVVQYLRNELGFESDLNYQGPFGGGYPPATSFRGDWMSVRWNRALPSGTPPPSRSEAMGSAMKTNPALRLFVGTGYYDLVSSYFAIEQAVAELEPELARRVTARRYAGGHAIYTDDAARHQLCVDAARFYAAGEPK